MAAPHAYGFELENGTRIVHGQGSIRRDAFPPEMKLPGTMQVLTPGNRGDASCPSFSGPSGLFQFDTSCRMPRHVHMAPKDDSTAMGYVVEKVIVLNGIAIAELGGEVYVVPPKTMVTIARGVPHAWVAASPGLDLQEIGVADEKVVSDGQFLAVYEYETATAFFPTKQTQTLREESDYVKCDELHSIIIPDMSIDYLKKKAYFIWGRTCRKL
jgi:quercetin dioxygenase-like cupin family protein